MQVSFQTPNYCFEADFNNTPVAKAIVESLPLDSKIATASNRIHFKTEVKADVAEPSRYVNVGEIAYSLREQSINIFFSPWRLIPETELIIVIGRTEINPVEIGKMKPGDPIRVMPMSPAEENSARKKTEFPTDRKLTQTEIDVLVEQLLAEKKAKENR